MNITDWSSSHIYISKNIINYSTEEVVSDFILVHPDSILNTNIVSSVGIKLKINPNEIISVNIVSPVTVTDIVLIIQPNSIINNSAIGTKEVAPIYVPPQATGGAGAPSKGWQKYALRVKRGYDPDNEQIVYKSLKLKKTIVARSINNISEVSKVKIIQKEPILCIKTKEIKNKSIIGKVSIINPPYNDEEEILLFLLAA